MQPEDSSLEPPLTDDELTALALGTEACAPIPDEEDTPAPWLIGSGALPLWYMPPVARRARSRWTAPLVVAVVSAFLLIDALGLCNTYGVLSL